MSDGSAAPTPLMHRRAVRLALLVAALTIPAIVIGTQLYIGYRMRGIRVPLATVVLTQLCHWEIWAIAGPLVWSLERRWPLTGARRRQSFVRHLAAAAAVSIGVLSLYYLAYHAMVRLPIVSGFFTGMDRSFSLTAIFFAISYLHLELLLYAAIVATAHAVHATALLRAKEHESLRLEAELTGAKLTALRTQLQPHFLFNTLHVIGSSVLQRQNDRAVRMLAELGELLRATLAKRDSELTTLGDEMAYLRRYLRIEGERFGDRLKVDWQLDEAALDRLVPPFILQPLIENAFRHGIAHRMDEAVLRIAARLGEDPHLRAGRDGGHALHIEIYNDGPPLPDRFAIDRAPGYGLKNVSERMRTRKPAGRVDIANLDGGVRVLLVLPVWEIADVASLRDGARDAAW
jgi:two-component system LytT family sensor kinase